MQRLRPRRVGLVPGGIHRRGGRRAPRHVIRPGGLRLWGPLQVSTGPEDSGLDPVFEPALVEVDGVTIEAWVGHPDSSTD